MPNGLRRKEKKSIAGTVALGVIVGMLAAYAEAQETTTDADVETYMVDDIEVRTDGIVTASDPYRVDTFTLELGPAEGKEYKYRLEVGRTMLYSWESSGPVRTEMHSQADDQEQGTAEFFDVDLSGNSGHGAYTAPFSGIHGWYWLNLSQNDAVTVTLRSAGFYSHAIEFPSEQIYELDEVPGVEASDGR